MAEAVAMESLEFLPICGNDRSNARRHGSICNAKSRGTLSGTAALLERDEDCLVVHAFGAVAAGAA